MALAFDDEKHPAPEQPESIVEDDDEVNGPLLMPFERDAFNFSDFVFPLVDCPCNDDDDDVAAVTDGVGSSSTINNDFNSYMLLIVISGIMLFSPSTSRFVGAGKFNGIQTLANKPASTAPFFCHFI